jgi:hypothetical protein
MLTSTHEQGIGLHDVREGSGKIRRKVSESNSPKRHHRPLSRGHILKAVGPFEMTKWSVVQVWWGKSLSRLRRVIAIVVRVFFCWGF